MMVWKGWIAGGGLGGAEMGFFVMVESIFFFWLKKAVFRR